MVTLGQILGTVVGFPLLCFLINIFYYSNKYNDDAEQYYKEYMNNSYDIEVTMPEDNSKYYLENQDEDVKTVETFMTTIDGNYFANPSFSTKSFNRTLFFILSLIIKKFKNIFSCFIISFWKHFFDKKSKC